MHNTFSKVFLPLKTGYPCTIQQGSISYRNICNFWSFKSKFRCQLKLAQKAARRGSIRRIPEARYKLSNSTGNYIYMKLAGYAYRQAISIQDYLKRYRFKF